jgi:hypothetical protein
MSVEGCGFIHDREKESSGIHSATITRAGRTTLSPRR